MTHTSYDELLRRRREDIKARNNATNHRPNHYKKWTSEEEELVSDPSLTIDEKAEILGRSIYAVGARMTMLGVRSNNDRPWTDEELELASDPSISHKELAERLNRSKDSVISKRFILRAQGHEELLCGRFHEYTDEEDEFIMTHSPRESSDHLGLSMDAIKGRRYKLRKSGKLSPVESHFSDDDLKIVTDLSLSNRECAEILNRSAKSIADKRYYLRRKGLIKPQGD